MFGLETARLIVRPWRAEDRPAFAAMMSDAEVMRYLNHGRTFTDAQVDEWLARQARQLEEHDVCMGAVIEKSSGRLIGISGTQPLGTTGDLEIGWIFARETWGRGYATEAGSAAMQHVLGPLGRTRVVAIIDPDNEPSKAVAARLGMQWEARYVGAQLGYRLPDVVVDLFYKERAAGSSHARRPPEG
jgi:RimJ/RimL family protein N-acetyltransferase